MNSNHKKRVERIVARLEYNHYSYNFCNDLIGGTTTVYVETSEGNIQIIISKPTLHRHAFTIVKDEDTVGFCANFHIDQSDLLCLIDDMVPTRHDNVVPFK